MKKRKILILFLILIILIITIFFLKRFPKLQKYDDFLFLKLYSKGILNKDINLQNDKKHNNKKEYHFKIDYKNTDLKSIDLAETINKESLIYEKIAPGTNGEFSIILDSNQKLKYKIQFISINEKPKNLKFKALKDGSIISEATTLEELTQKLTGNINRNEKINIIIKWYWDYEDKENEKNVDMQDTKDSGNIKKYEFNIYTIGEEFS